jgi:hypothetical protein
MSDPLEHLLKHADVAMPAPMPSHGIADRVRRRARNQRMTRSALTAAVIVGLGLLVLQFPPRRPQPMARNVPSARSNFASSIDTDAKVDLLVADILEEHAARPHQTPAEADDYLWQLSQQRDRAALILVRSGDRIYQQSHDRPAAEASYRLAIELFPNSPASAVAHRRLRTLDAKGTEL